MDGGSLEFGGLYHQVGWESISFYAVRLDLHSYIVDSNDPSPMRRRRYVRACVCSHVQQYVAKHDSLSRLNGVVGGEGSVW